MPVAPPVPLEPHAPSEAIPTDGEARSMMAALPGVTDETKRADTVAVLNRYSQARRTAGAVPFAEPPEEAAQRQQRAESLFGGLDKLDSVLPADAREQLARMADSTPNPLETRAAAVNQAYIAQLRPDLAPQIEGNWDVVRRDAARSLGIDKAAPSDTELYGAIQKSLQQQRDERDMLSRMTMKIQQSALEGGDGWLKTYGSFIAGARSTPGYNPVNADRYRQMAQAAYDEVSPRAHVIGPVVGQLAPLFEAAKADTDPLMSEEKVQRKEAIIDVLEHLSPEDRQAAIQTAAAQTHREQSMERGPIEKAGEAFTRGLESTALALHNTIASFTDSPEESHRRQIWNEVVQAYNTEADPVKGSNVVMQGLYNTAAMIPQLGLVANPEIGVPLLMAANTDQRMTELRKRGVDEGKALPLALAQAGVDTATNFITGNMIFRGVPAGLLGSAPKSVTQLITRAGKVAAIEGTTLTAATLIQHVTPLVLQDMAAGLSTAFPQVEWKKELDGFKNALPETVATLGPLLLLGVGVASFRDVGKFRDYLADETNLRAVGFSKEQAARLAAIPTLEGRIAAIQAENATRQMGTPEQQAAVEEINSRLADNENIHGRKNPNGTIDVYRGLGPNPEQVGNVKDMAEFQQMDEALRAGAARATREADGSYTVRDSAGNVVDRANTPEAAQQLLDHLNTQAKTEALAPGELPAVVDENAMPQSPQALGLTPHPSAAEMLQNAWDSLSKNRRALLALVNSRDVSREWANQYGVAENKATLFARQEATGIHEALSDAMGRRDKKGRLERNVKDEEALTFMVEAQRNRPTLERWKQELAAARGTGLPFKWLTKASKAVNHALANFDRMAPVAEKYEATQDAHLDQQQAMGIKVERRAGYVYHAQDVESAVETVLGKPGGGTGGGFKHERAYDSFVDSILGGVKPKTLNAVTLMEMRIRTGQSEINRQLWATAARSVQDPSTGMALVTDPDHGTRNFQGKQVPDITVPDGYEPRTFGARQIAVHKGYTGIFDALTTPSVVTKTAAGRVLMQTAGFAKSVALAFDTFHLGRLAFYQTVMRGSSSYSKGLLLLDHSTADLTEKLTTGDLAGLDPQAKADILAHKATLDMLVDRGLNIAAVGDNLYAKAVQALPGIRTYHHFLFDKFQRGGMAESAIIEQARIEKAFPNLSREQVATRVARDLNVRFGNLGEQSWVTSRTYRDLLKVMFLAPGWNEGLIRAELGAYSQLGETAKIAATEQRLVAGTLLRNVGGLLVGQFIANQAINYITRGKPTWENPEEGMSAKISAWIPDVFGDGKSGMFLNPFSLPAEITNQIMGRIEGSKTVTGAVQDVASYKLSNVGRAANILLTKEDMGKHLFSDAELWAHAGKALFPLPLQTGAITKASQSIHTGETTQHSRGEIQKQLISSVGLKTENAPTPLARIYRLSQEYKKEHGLEKNFIGEESDYAELKHTLAVGNKEDQAEAMQALLAKKTPAQVETYFNRQVRLPFTGAHKTEGPFKATLNPEQLATYADALADRKATAQRALTLLKVTRQNLDNTQRNP